MGRKDLSPRRPNGFRIFLCSEKEFFEWSFKTFGEKFLGYSFFFFISFHISKTHKSEKNFVIGKSFAPYKTTFDRGMCTHLLRGREI